MKPIYKLAPIALFVYNRLWHTQQTVNSLRKNTLASQSNLIIYSDGPKNSKATKDVELVRDYIKTIRGFESIKIIERERNYGLAKSIISGVSEVVDKYGKIIVLEDDLVSSSYFLKYMNDALNLYEIEDDVISIHGYIYPIESKLPETFFIKGADCWGWATWRRGWDLFESNGKFLLDEIKKQKLQKEFDFNNSFAFTKMLKGQINGKNDSWAVRWYASAFLNNKLTLYPGGSLINNIGNDGSGTHSNINTDKFISNISSKEITVVKIPKEEDLMSKLEIIKYFKGIRPNKIKLIKDIVRNLFN